MRPSWTRPHERNVTKVTEFRMSADVRKGNAGTPVGPRMQILRRSPLLALGTLVALVTCVACSAGSQDTNQSDTPSTGGSAATDGDGGGATPVGADGGKAPASTNDAGSAPSNTGKDGGAATLTDGGNAKADAGTTDAGSGAVDAGPPIVGSCTMIVPGTFNVSQMATKNPSVDPNGPDQAMLCVSYPVYTRYYPSPDVPASAVCTTMTSDDGCSVSSDCTFTVNGLHDHALITRTVGADGKHIVTDYVLTGTDNNFVPVLDCSFHNVAVRQP